LSYFIDPVKEIKMETSKNENAQCFFPNNINEKQNLGKLLKG
jgi:hypothetical protein